MIAAKVGASCGIKRPSRVENKHEMLVVGPYHTRISCIPSGHSTAIEHGHCHSEFSRDKLCVVHSYLYVYQLYPSVIHY